jgi:membrane-associated phospholipid phosphatase
MKTFVFKLKPFLLLNFLALIILYSWVNSNTRVYWDILDLWSFEILNGSLLQSSQFWSGTWAVLSVRIADIFPLFFILLFFYYDKVLFEKSQRIYGLVAFVSMLMLMLIVREFLDFYIDYKGLGRPSPSLQLDSVVWLSELYPNLSLKDSSGSSFPGDHAAVLITWLGFCLFFIRNFWSWAAILLVIFFSLPRLIAGAHWLSDVLVGGVGIALISLAFGLYTPVLNHINGFFNKWADRILKYD